MYMYMYMPSAQGPLDLTDIVISRGYYSKNICGINSSTISSSISSSDSTINNSSSSSSNRGNCCCSFSS